MDDQVIEMIRDTIRDGFTNTNRKIDLMADALRDHTLEDKGYWRKIDDQEAQIRLVKTVGSTSLIGSLIGWLWLKFHG